MKRFGLHTALSILVVSSLVTGATPAVAEDVGDQPVAIISVAGIDKLVANSVYLTKIAGVAPVGEQVVQQMTMFTKGVDKTRPWGVVVTTDGGNFKPIGFVPVSDMQGS